MAIGPNPRYSEELRIGGGYGETVDGGVDIEKSGDISTDGNVTLKGILSAGVTPQALTDAAGLIDGGKIQIGTVDTTGLADDAVSPAKLDDTGDYLMNNITLNGNVALTGGGNIGTDINPNLITIADDSITIESSAAGPHLIVQTDDGNPAAIQLGQTIPPNANALGLIDFKFDRGSQGQTVGFFRFFNGPSQATALAQILVQRGTADTKGIVIFQVSGGESIRLDEGRNLKLANDLLFTGGGNIGTDTDTNLLGIADNALTVNGRATLGAASTDLITCTGRLIVRTVSDAGPMTNTAGTYGEMVINSSDNKFYGCTATGSPATWSALN